MNDMEEEEEEKEGRSTSFPQHQEPLLQAFKVAGMPSFSTMYTAINTLSGHYASYGNKYPVPEKRKTRLQQQYKEIERAWRSRPHGELARGRDVAADLPENVAPNLEQLDLGVDAERGTRGEEPRAVDHNRAAICTDCRGQTRPPPHRR